MKPATISSTKIYPLGNKVLLKDDDREEVSKGGIVIPQTAHDGKFAHTATVVAVGKGRVLENGQLVEIDLKTGDRVVLAKHHGQELDIDGKLHRLVNYDVIEGVIED